MRAEHLDLLVCPKTKKSLELRPGFIVENDRIKCGELSEPVSGNMYTIRNFIPRFIPEDNYVRSFSYQWQIHARTQFDDYTGSYATRERFEKETRWGPNLAGERILEVGCGGGRFTPYALKTGATVVSFDFSNSVESNHHWNGSHKNLLVVQADVYEMPFRRQFFDKAFCLGVLQHTPDPKAAFLAVIDHLKPGGQVASDIYAKIGLLSPLVPKYLARMLTTRMDPEKLYGFVKWYVTKMWPAVKWMRKLPRGQYMSLRLLIPDYVRAYPDIPDAILREWSILDSFDMLSPTYDQPQTIEVFKEWHKEAGLEEIDVHYGYNGIEGRGVKPT